MEGTSRSYSKVKQNYTNFPIILKTGKKGNNGVGQITKQNDQIWPSGITDFVTFLNKTHYIYTNKISLYWCYKHKNKPNVISKHLLHLCLKCILKKVTFLFQFYFIKAIARLPFSKQQVRKLVGERREGWRRAATLKQLMIKYFFMDNFPSR